MESITALRQGADVKTVNMATSSNVPLCLAIALALETSPDTGASATH